MNNPRSDVYLKRLQYERPVSVTSSPANRYIYQDFLIANSIKNQEMGSRILRADAATEATVWSRYGLILKQYVDLLTGFPEYLR